MLDTSDPKAGANTEPKAARDTPANSDPPRSWLVPIATAAILASAFCVYYFVYVGARREYLVNRNFRSLAALGAHIQRVVSTHGSILEFYSDLAQKEDLSKYLLVRKEDEELQTADKREESRKDYLQYLAPELGLTKGNIGVKSPPPPRLDVQRRDGRWDLVLGAHRHENARADYLGSLNLDELLRLPAASLPFDDILLVTDDGRVVYQEKKAGPQFTTLSSLMKARVDGAGTKADGPETQGGGSAPSNGKKPLQGQDTTLHLADILLAGTRYKLFLQPVLIDIFNDDPTGAEPAREWKLCGLRSTRALEWEALSISYTVIIWFTAVFFAICMGGPVLKLIFMNQRERFPLHELGFLSLFMVLLAGVFTLTTLEMVDVRAASDTDAQLERLGKTLSNDVHDDLGKMRDQLVDWCKADGLNTDLRKSIKNKVIRNTPGKDAKPNPLVELTPGPNMYPFLTNVFWTDDDGHQVVKWSTSGYVTPMIDVSGLRVFREPKRIYLDGKGPPIYFDSILPPNKLEYLAALGTTTADCHANLEGVRGDVAGGSAFVTGQPLSLIDPILPYGYGFALVDDTGLVLFHSDKTKDGRENFREENDWNKELYAGTFGHAASQSLTINYLGKDYRARAVPIPGITQAPWSLIVYADLEAERTLGLQTMTMASTLLLAILAGPALVAAICCLWRRPRFAPEWIWPNPHRMATYVYQICLYTVLIVVFLFVGFHGPSEQIVISCAAVPYSALLLSFWCFRRYPSARDAARDRNAASAEAFPVTLTVLSAAAFLLVLFFHRSNLKALAALLTVVAVAVVPLLDGPRRYISILDRHRRRLQAAGERSGARPWPFLTHSRCYAVSVLLMLLLIGVLTPMALFRASLAVERRLGIKQAQRHLASALTERRATILDNCETGEIGAAACEAFETPGSGVWEKIVPNPSPAAGRGPEIVKHDTPAGEELYEDWFRKLIYLLHHEYNTTAAETLGVIQDRVPPNPGSSFPDWSWENPGENPAGPPPATVRLRWHGLHPLPSESGLEEKDLVITSDVPAMSGAVLSGTGIAVGVMLVIGGVLWMLVRKVFLIHVAPLKITGVREVAECIRAGRNVLILTPPAANFDLEAAATLNLATLAREAKWAETVDLDALPLSGVIAIRYFEYTSDAATIDQKLILLLRLVQRENTQVAAIMEVPASTDDYRRMFPLMAVVDLRDEPFLWLKQYEGPAQNLIWEECRPMPALWPLGAQLAKEIRLETNILDDTIASEILERADPYYRLIWKECSNEQKFVLSQLAEDGLMNPVNGRAIRQLIRRGVIVQDPAFRIMNESFRRFLRSATTLEMKQRWIAESRRTGWGRMHGAFFTTMIVLGVFLLTTQNALWQSSAAYVTTAFGALGTLAKLFNAYRGGATGEKAN